MHEYIYHGPVMKFDTCVEKEWRGTTYAVSEAKARSNLIFRYKKERGLLPNTKISLPGKMINPS